jgi:hypothetical protein
MWSIHAFKLEGAVKLFIGVPITTKSAASSSAIIRSDSKTRVIVRAWGQDRLIEFEIRMRGRIGREIALEQVRPGSLRHDPSDDLGRDPATDRIGARTDKNFQNCLVIRAQSKDQYQFALLTTLISG